MLTSLANKQTDRRIERLRTLGPHQPGLVEVYKDNYQQMLTASLPLQ